MNKFQFTIYAGILWIGLSGCAYNTQREKHFYLQYGQKGYLHYPTDKNEWLTVEVESAGYGAKAKPIGFIENTNPDIITIFPLEDE